MIRLGKSEISCFVGDSIYASRFFYTEWIASFLAMTEGFTGRMNAVPYRFWYKRK